MAAAPNTRRMPNALLSFRCSAKRSARQEARRPRKPLPSKVCRNGQQSQKHRQSHRPHQSLPRSFLRLSCPSSANRCAFRQQPGNLLNGSMWRRGRCAHGWSAPFPKRSSKKIRGATACPLPRCPVRPLRIAPASKATDEPDLRKGRMRHLSWGIALAQRLSRRGADASHHMRFPCGAKDLPGHFTPIRQARRTMPGQRRG